MTPQRLKHICDLIGNNGQTKLAKMIEVEPRTIRKKLAGETPITKRDVAAIKDAVRKHIEELRQAIA